MSTATISISEDSQRIVQELARQTGASEGDVLNKALDEYRRKVFFEQLNADFARLRSDPQTWAEELAERKLLEATLMDGQDLEERWSEDGRCLNPPANQEESQ